MNFLAERTRSGEEVCAGDGDRLSFDDGDDLRMRPRHSRRRFGGWDGLEVAGLFFDDEERYSTENSSVNELDS